MAIRDNGVTISTGVRIDPYVEGRRRPNAGMETVIGYVNRSKCMLYVKTQANLVLALEPDNSILPHDEKSPHLEVHLLYRIQHNDSIYETLQTIKGLEGQNCLNGEEIRNFRNRLIDLYRENPSPTNKGNFTHTIAKIYPIEVGRNGKAIYIRDLDILVSVDKNEMRYPHPNSNEGLNPVRLGDRKATFDHAGMLVKCVDNEQLLPCRYFHSGKGVVTVPSIMDPSMESGVYIEYYTKQDIGGICEHRREVLSFEEAEKKIGLYRTQEEAVSGGDPEVYHSLEEEKLKREERDRRHQQEIEKMEVEMAKLRTDHDLRERKYKQEIEKLEAQRSFSVVEDDLKEKKVQRDNYYEELEFYRKDYYDRRSAERKDSSEMIKWIPAMIGGGLLLLTILNNQRSDRLI